MRHSKRDLWDLINVATRTNGVTTEDAFCVSRAGLQMITYITPECQLQWRIWSPFWQ